VPNGQTDDESDAASELEQILGGSRAVPLGDRETAADRRRDGQSGADYAKPAPDGGATLHSDILIGILAVRAFNSVYSN